MYTGLRSTDHVDEKADAPLHVLTKETLPPFIDYRTMGYVTPVKDQVCTHLICTAYKSN